MTELSGGLQATAGHHTSPLTARRQGRPAASAVAIVVYPVVVADGGEHLREALLVLVTLRGFVRRACHRTLSLPDLFGLVRINWLIGAC
jgi:hypothetical protein